MCRVAQAQLRATLDVIPAYTWYANPPGGLTFVNERLADYLGLPKDHPLGLGVDMGAEWDSHIPLGRRLPFVTTGSLPPANSVGV